MNNLGAKHKMTYVINTLHIDDGNVCRIDSRGWYQKEYGISKVGLANHFKPKVVWKSCA